MTSTLNDGIQEFWISQIITFLHVSTLSSDSL